MIQIPNKFIVGFQRDLGFATYKDALDKIKCEYSWNNWRDKNIEPREFKNEFLTGFYIDFSVRRSSEWFGTGRNYWRVKDPRGFYLEITTENLEYLISVANINKGLIDLPLIWSWNKQRLILLDENSKDYKEAVHLSDIASDKIINKKDIKRGSKVLLNDGRIVEYLGSQIQVRPWAYSKNFDVHKVYAVILENGTIEHKSDYKIVAVIEEKEISKEESTKKLNDSVVSGEYCIFDFFQFDNDKSYKYDNKHIIYKDYKWKYS